ncbi:PRC-barrel domain-containing protein [Patulibacter minatonensis]|uniref:PRC-barrel domain-containing protein n=1 Tax=Patulibacter minatonensis TaxID=298163 RepID=UPI00047B19F7|nr:PRC-barrel domain-containing protein [Patulibacter minatonensis]
MQEIEAIEDWKGQDVVDVAEQKVGKLEDVWFRADAADPVLISVKSGLLGRKRHLVPLQGSTVTRSFVRVAFTEDQVSGAPQNDDDARLSADELAAVIAYYGVDVDGAQDAELESGDARQARIRAAREARAAADKAEQDAEAQAVAATEAADRAEAAIAEAEAAKQRSVDAAAHARDLRSKADAAKVPETRASIPSGVQD